MNFDRLLSLKRFDAYGQLVVMVGPLLFGTIPAVFTAYMLTGGWQLVSAVATLATADPDRRWKAPLRTFYNIALLIIVVSGLCCLADEETILDYLIAMLFATPVAAVLYLIVSFTEMSGLAALTAEVARTNQIHFHE